MKKVELKQLIKEVIFEERKTNHFDIEILEKYIKEYGSVIRLLTPILKKRYANKDFKGLAKIIDSKLKPIHEKYASQPFIDYDYAMVSDWLRGIEDEPCVIGDECSYFTALRDSEFVYRLAEQFDLDDNLREELDTIWRQSIGSR